MRWLLLLCAPILMAQTPPPLVPEGIHRDADGPSELCGFSAPDVPSLERSIATDPTFIEENSTTEYRVFNRESDFVQFVFPRPGRHKFPMATCRKVTSASGGSFITRDLYCGGSRTECDRIFLQFKELDESVRRMLKGDAS